MTLEVTNSGDRPIQVGETHGQRMLLKLGENDSTNHRGRSSMADEELGSFAPRLALLSSAHEMQYSRLFSS